MRTLALLTLLFLAAPTTAQVVAGQSGFLVSSGGTNAGSFCRSGSCTPDTLSTRSGSVLGMTVRAPFNSPYIIAWSAPGAPCQSFPAFSGVLLLDLATTNTLALGLVTTPDPILSCWGAKAQQSLTVPPLPANVQVVLQAVATTPSGSGTMQVSFSDAVLLTIN